MDDGKSTGIHTGDVLKHPTSINDLPADVLLISFRDLFRDTRPPKFVRPLQSDPWPTYWGHRARRGHDIEHPAPECLAAVCPYWREVLSNLREF